MEIILICSQWKCSLLSPHSSITLRLFLFSVCPRCICTPLLTAVPPPSPISSVYVPSSLQPRCSILSGSFTLLCLLSAFSAFCFFQHVRLCPGEGVQHCSRVDAAFSSSARSDHLTSAAASMPSYYCHALLHVLISIFYLAPNYCTSTSAQPAFLCLEL